MRVLLGTVALAFGVACTSGARTDDGSTSDAGTDAKAILSCVTAYGGYCAGPFPCTFAYQDDPDAEATCPDYPLPGKHTRCCFPDKRASCGMKACGPRGECFIDLQSRGIYCEELSADGATPNCGAVYCDDARGCFCGDAAASHCECPGGR